MGWAVILLPDERGGRCRAKNLAGRAPDAGFTSMIYEGDNRPHLSLMVLDTQDGTLERAAERFAASSRPAAVTFASVGSFGEDVIYLSPEPTAELLEMNRRLTQELGPLAALADRHYLPGEYRPHMTAAFKIPEGEFARAMRVVKDNFTVFRASFETAAVVKFNPVKIVGIYKLGSGASSAAAVAPPS